MTREEIETRLQEIDELLFGATFDPMICALSLFPERDRLEKLLDDMEQAS